MGRLTRAYCKVCRDYRPCEWDRHSHGLHLMLSLLTLGLWVPVWLLIALSGKRRCRECGSRAYANAIEAWLLSPLGILSLCVAGAGGVILLAALSR